MSKLAIFGGRPVLVKKLPETYTVGDKEIKAVIKVLKKGPLSGFVASWNEGFLGGEQVRNLESYVAELLGIKNVVSFNSATTALQAAVNALLIGPGDEVIVPPYTMSATATCVLANGAVPVFSDIDSVSFCLDPSKLEAKINKNTRAIIVVNLFGGPAQFSKLSKIAKKYKIAIIEDNAQSFGARYKGKLCGTIGDIGVYSLNVNKIVQSGEGGLLVTNNSKYAMRARLVRNHGEVVADQIPGYKHGPVIGSNFRMTEITAAISLEQLKKLNFLLNRRIALAKHLTKRLKKIDGLLSPWVDSGNKHVYYVYPIKFDKRKVGFSRNLFIDAMSMEGFPMSKGYVKPLYLLKVFQDKKAFNNTAFPFVNNYYDGSPKYSAGLCPVCERLWKEELTFTEICQYPRTLKDIDLFVEAVEKVMENKNQLLDYENNI